MTVSLPVRGHGRLLLEKHFNTMKSEFSNWTMSDFIRQLESRKSKGRVLSFVRGLRLSAHLIYAIRDLLVGSDLTANWGHLLDKEGVFCSPECDIIIHKTDGQIGQWNGNKEPVMDFRFISMAQAIVVISCKSQVKSIDKKYPKSIKKYVKKVWLFGECCGPKSAKALTEKAKKVGYEKFWYLYTWSPKTEPDYNNDGWFDFVKEVKKLQNLTRESR